MDEQIKRARQQLTGVSSFLSSLQNGTIQEPATLHQKEDLKQAETLIDIARKILFDLEK